MTVEITDTLLGAIVIVFTAVTFVIALRHQVRGTKVSIKSLSEKVDDEVTRSAKQLEKVVSQIQQFVNDISEIEKHFATLLDTKTADARYVNKEAFEAYHQSFTTSIDRLNETIGSLQKTILEMKHEK